MQMNIPSAMSVGMLVGFIIYFLHSSYVGSQEYLEQNLEP